MPLTPHFDDSARLYCNILCIKIGTFSACTIDIKRATNVIYSTGSGLLCFARPLDLRVLSLALQLSFFTLTKIVKKLY